MRLLLTGSIAVDRIMNFPGEYSQVIQPDKLHVLSLSVLVDHLIDTRGGIAANIAYNLALLGEKPVLYGSVGRDAVKYMEDLSLLGIDTSMLHYSKLPTATFTVLTDQADCQVGGFYPGAMSDSASLTLHHFDPKKDFIVISPHDPRTMARQVTEAKKKKFRYFYDIGQQVSNVPDEDVTAGIDGAEVLIVNDYEMEVVQKKTKMSQAEIIKKIPVVVITLGEKGSVFFDHGKKQAVKAIKVKSVVDPTGAGDAFRAGFLFGYLKKWPIEKCVQYGSAVATFAIQKHGTQEHSFSLGNVEKLVKESY